MVTTPRPVVDRVVRSTRGRAVERLERLTTGGLNETYRAHLRGGAPVVVRIARRSTPWFTDEDHLTGLARLAGVPAPEVIGVEHVEHDGHLLSFSVLEVLPGRALEDLAPDLTQPDLERLVVDAGELLARIHVIASDRGERHDLRAPSDDAVARAARAAHELAGPAAAAVVERGAGRLRAEVTTRPAPSISLAHGDFLPKHLLIEDGAVAGVIDWELAGPASPARDLARWQVSGGDLLHDRSDWLRRGYARVADPAAAAGGWVPAFAIDWALEVLAWEHPATPARRRRCVDVIARSVTA